MAQPPPVNSMSIPSLTQTAATSSIPLSSHEPTPQSASKTEAPISSPPPSLPSSPPSSLQQPSPSLPSPASPSPTTVGGGTPGGIATEPPPSIITQTPSFPPNVGGPTVTTAPTTSRVTVVVTNTSLPPETTLQTTHPSSNSSATPTNTSGSQDGRPAAGSTGLGLAKTVVAIAVPLLIVALIIIGLIIWWRKRKRNAKRHNTVEDSGPVQYVASGKPIRVGSASVHSDDPYENMNSGAGYRGWGSTSGGRKTAPIPLSSVSRSISDGGHGNNNHHATTSNFTQPGSPTNVGNSSPTGTDSSTVGVMPNPGALSASGGLRRGISNASSNYSTATTSERSDPANRDSQYQAMDGNDYDFSISGNPYAHDTQNPPVVQDVQARRHTRIETPPNMHYPQQGNSGIAQNF